MTENYLRGIDCSSVQGAVDFANPYIRFAILKSQEGNSGLDAQYNRNVKAAAAAGVTAFAYAFLYPLPHLNPEAQAAAFVKAAGPLATRPIFLDCEWPEVVPSKAGKKGWREWGCNPGQLAEWMRRCAAEVHRLTGIRPALYTYPWWWAAVRDGAPAYGYPRGGDVAWAADYPLWLADYRDGWPRPGSSPRVPRPWLTWTFWQFDGNGGLRLPNGVDCDFCVFRGDAAALEAFAAGRPIAGPEPTPGPPPELNTVLGLQARLQALGFDPGPIDGVRGAKTLAAIRAFQASRGLVADGVVGPKTRAALADGAV